ncbi:hypothetical protein ABBQ38_008658 [Trebouxia sp. C0009 RCD-2024]
MVLCSQPSHLQAKVPHGRAATRPGGHSILFRPDQTNHLQRQSWMKPQFPVCDSQSRKFTVGLVNMSKADSTSAAARTEFCRAGIPDEVTTKVLKRYQTLSPLGH